MTANKREVREIRGLTAIRGVAAWWIVTYHFREALPDWTPLWLMSIAGYGFLAVDLFFQLSGFVIALNYADKFRIISMREFGRFLGLRIARIYPLHILMLSLFVLNPVAISLLSRQGSFGYRYDPGYFWLSLGLIQNWGFTSDIAWNIPAWSISTEWFAYLVFPAIIWITYRISINATRSFWLWVLLLVILGIIVHSLGTGLGGNIQHFGLVRCVLEFWTGICLFYFWRQHRLKYSVEGDIAALLSTLCYCAFIWLHIPDYVAFPIGFSLLIYALSRDSWILGRLLELRVLIHIGEISYSTYLVHYFIKDWVKFLAVRPGVPAGLAFTIYIVVTGIMSLILYRFIEVPGRRYVRSLVNRRPKQFAHARP